MTNDQTNGRLKACGGLRGDLRASSVKGRQARTLRPRLGGALSSQNGTPLDPNDANFTILPKGVGISGG